MCMKNSVLFLTNTVHEKLSHCQPKRKTQNIKNQKEQIHTPLNLKISIFFTYKLKTVQNKQSPGKNTSAMNKYSKIYLESLTFFYIYLDRFCH